MKRSDTFPRLISCKMIFRGRASSAAQPPPSSWMRAPVAHPDAESGEPSHSYPEFPNIIWVQVAIVVVLAVVVVVVIVFPTPSLIESMDEND